MNRAFVVLSLVVLVLAVALLGTFLFSLFGGAFSGDSQSEDTAFADTSAALDSTTEASEQAVSYTQDGDAEESYELDALDFDLIEDGSMPCGFDLSGQDDAPALSEESLFAIALALAPYVEDGDAVGFLLLDCSTGRGFAYNIDESIYGASTIKAPYAAYLLQTIVEGGEASLGDSLTSTAEDIAKGGPNGWSGGPGADTTSTLETLVSNAIVYSDNSSYAALRAAYDDEDFAAWLEELGIEGSVAQDTNFPHYAVRDAARMWTAIRSYLATETDEAQWLSSLLSQTETSFLREALSNVSGASVLAKAGWYAGTTDDYDSVSESGIVTVDGTDYLLCVMTGAAYSDAAVEDLEVLASAVFAARADLG